MMDFCDAVGIEPVFTTNAVGPETPQDMADLVEYLYGGPDTTWGKMRIADGRTKPYETKFFELGNVRTLSCMCWAMTAADAAWLCGLCRSSTIRRTQLRWRRWKPRPRSSDRAANFST